MTAIGVFSLLVCLTVIQAVPPKFTDETLEDYTGFADNFKSFYCNIARATSRTRYEWYHNGTLVTTSNSMFFLHDSSIHVMQDPVTENYQGTYQCKAVSEEGTLLGRKINVVFSMVGKFFKSDDVVEEAAATVGKDLALTCPPRTLSRNVFYHWGGRQVSGAWFLPRAKHYMIMEDGTLLFANVKDKDLEYFNVVKEGVSCSIESKGKTKRLAFSHRFLLREVGEKNTEYFGPKIKTELKYREVAERTLFVVFRCGAVGLPTPDYSWTFTGLNGIETNITSGKGGYELQDFNHVLMVSPVGMQHDGWYKCRATSNYDGQAHVDEKTARLSIKGKPQWDTDGELSDAERLEGSSFQWTCKAYGNPDPTYTWVKNGDELFGSDNYDIINGTITFKSLSDEDEGLYQCQAENDFGDISTSAVLTVQPAPTTPPPMQCNVKKLNLMFLVDGSGSVPAATFREFKQFMKLLVEKFDIGEDSTHVGVLQYSSKPSTGLEFHFTEHQTLAAVQDAISRVVYHYGAYTFGGYAMNLAQQIMNRYDRADAKNVWVLLMDDGLWDKRLARKISKSIRQSGTKVIVLDTGNIMHDIADQGLGFSSENLKENVETVAQEICK